MKLIISALFWVAGLMLAGSDGPFMPWTNVLGLIVFFGANISIGREAQRRKNARFKRRIDNVCT